MLSTQASVKLAQGRRSDLDYQIVQLQNAGVLNAAGRFDNHAQADVMQGVVR